MTSSFLMVLCMRFCFVPVVFKVASQEASYFWVTAIVIRESSLFLQEKESKTVHSISINNIDPRSFRVDNHSDVRL